MASAMLENHYERTSGGLSLFYNWGRHKINDGYHPGKEPQESLFHSKDLMAGVSWYQSASLYEGNRLTVGLDYQHFGGQSWNEAIADGLRTPGVDKTQDEVAAYADFRQDIGQWLSLNAGVRVDHHSHVGTELIPQGGLAFHLPRQAELKVMASKGFRNPTIREMYMFPPQNPSLRPERLMNYELSFSQQTLGGSLTYGANLYYINGKNLIMTLPNAEGRPQNVNTGAIENWGVEGQRGMAHQYLLEHAGQLQLGTHGTSRHVRSRAQTLRGRQLQKRTMEPGHRHPIHQRPVYFHQPGEHREIRTVEPERSIQALFLCHDFLTRRKPVGPTLCNHAGISHAQGNIPCGIHISI